MLQKTIHITLMIALCFIMACKDQKPKQHKYNSPIDTPCLTAGNALNSDDVVTLRKQLEKGVNPDLRFLSGDSLLHCAAGMGSIECVKLLIEYGADINAEYAEGTALHTITLVYLPNRSEIAQTLVNAGIDVTIKDPDGCTALDNARANNCEKTVSIIEERMKQLGIEIEESFVEISKKPDEVSIKKVKGKGFKSCFITQDGRFVGKNVSLLDVLTSILTSTEWVFETDKLPDEKYWIEVKPVSTSYEEGRLILETALENALGIKFIKEKRIVNLYALSVDPKKTIKIKLTGNEEEPDYEYTEKGIRLTNYDMDELCSFLEKKLEIEVVNHTSLQGQYELYLDFDPLVFQENLNDYGLLLQEIKAEREGIVVKKERI